MRPLRRPLPFTALLVLALAASGRAQARPDTAALARLLVAEDARGLGAAGVDPLRGGLRSGDSLLRRIAARGIGRLQRPDLARELVPLLGDPVAAVRREAANGIAQSLKRVRRGPMAADTTDISVARAREVLAAALATERDPSVIDALVGSIGRLPIGDTTGARAAEAAIVARSAGGATRLMLQGYFRMAQARRVTGGLTERGVAVVRSAAMSNTDPAARRLAVLTLNVNGSLDAEAVRRAAGDADEQVRRLALAGIAAVPAAERPALVARGLADRSPIVRVGAVVAARLAARPADCAPLLPLLNDPVPLVALATIDSLGSPCADPAATSAALERALTAPITGGPVDHRWQRGAHALTSLAKIDPVRAARHLPRFAAAAHWGERLAAATAAATLADTLLLRRLAGDPDHNVQEAAIAGLARHAKHGADAVYLAALASPGYQVVLAAATALAGTTDPAALDRALAALDRISAEGRETSRDPRMMLLRRIGELGGAATAPRLERYLADIDSTVALTAAQLLGRWTGTPRQFVRRVPAPAPEPLAALLLGGPVDLRVTMAPSSGGGSFVIRLFTDDAPATAARLIRLAGGGAYAGKLLQRVEANFVTQGGGGDASEYVGDGPFMRDELGLRPQLRGTIGISARGRDTGDAQLYLNLVDNPILDHEYTTAGMIVDGLAVAEAILEGDRIAKVEVVRKR